MISLPRFRPAHSMRRGDLGRYGSGNFVYGGVSNVESCHLGWSFSHGREEFRYFRVASATVCLGAFRPVPQTDREGFRSRRGHKRDFVLKPLLFAKPRNHFLLDFLSKLGKAVGF